jgi:putative endonuclease
MIVSVRLKTNAFRSRRRLRLLAMTASGLSPREQLATISVFPFILRTFHFIINNDMNRKYYVYILTNVRNTILYTGVTNDLKRRIYEHRNKLANGFTKKYNVDKLVYYEDYDDSYNAITREKKIKAGSRKKKFELINGFNPEWKDLYNDI